MVAGRPACFSREAMAQRSCRDWPIAPNVHPEYVSAMTEPSVPQDGSIDQAADRLKHDLAIRLAGGPVTVVQIHDSVCAVVRLMRSAGVPPEKVLHSVKDIMQDGGMAPLGATARLSTGELDMLYPNMVTWCIQAYYETEPDPQSAG